MFGDAGGQWDGPAASAAVPRWLRRVERAVALATAALLVSLMLITVADVLGRYAFNRPLAGAAEWAELAMGLMIYGGLFQAATRSEHIRIDLLDHLWRPAVMRYVTSLCRIAAALLLLFMAWRLWVKGRELAEFGDVSSYLGVPLGPMAFAMAAAAVLAAIAYVFEARSAYAAAESALLPRLDPPGADRTGV